MAEPTKSSDPKQDSRQQFKIFSSGDFKSLKDQISTITIPSSHVVTGVKTKREPIDEKIRKRRIENDNTEKDQKLKERTLHILFWFLSIETALIFALAFLQGFRFNGFNLDEWSFRLVVAATLGQITAMLLIAVHHLFPAKKR